MAEEFDEKVMRAAAKILDIEQLSTEAKYQLKLPVARGGFGLRSMAQARDAAWVATMAQSVQFCVQHATAVTQTAEKCSDSTRMLH
jgi:hypothetical protein